MQILIRNNKCPLKCTLRTKDTLKMAKKSETRALLECHSALMGTRKTLCRNNIFGIFTSRMFKSNNLCLKQLTHFISWNIWCGLRRKINSNLLDTKQSYASANFKLTSPVGYSFTSREAGWLRKDAQTFGMVPPASGLEDARLYRA